MRALDEIGLSQQAPTDRRPAPTDAQVERFQRAFDVVLPDEHLALLRHSNGGHPLLDSFVPEGADPEDRWAVDHFHHLDDGDGPESLWRETPVWRRALGDHVVPVAADGGGNQILLDYTGAPPAVILAVAEGDVSVRPVAPSFGAFVDLLHEDPDMI